MSAVNLQLTPVQRRIELARPWVLFSCYVGLAAAGWWWLAVPLAAVVCLAAFVQMHDAMHNSLGLSKGATKRVLTLSGLLILKSGHGLQVTHLRHHGRCLTEADPEGAPATWRFSRVLWQGPWHTLMLRREALRIAPNTKQIQLLETALTLALLVGFAGLYWATGSLVGLVVLGRGLFYERHHAHLGVLHSAPRIVAQPRGAHGRRPGPGLDAHYGVVCLSPLAPPLPARAHGAALPGRRRAAAPARGGASSWVAAAK